MARKKLWITSPKKANKRPHQAYEELGDMTKTHQLIKSGLKTGEKVVSLGTHKVMPGDEIVPAADGQKK